MVDSFSTSCIANPRTAAEAALAAHFAAAFICAGSVPLCTDVKSASIDSVTLWAIALKISFAASALIAVAAVCAKVRGRASVPTGLALRPSERGRWCAARSALRAATEESDGASERLNAVHVTSHLLRRVHDFQNPETSPR